MKLVRFLHKGTVYSGTLTEEKITVEASEGKKSFSLADVRLLAPVLPSKIVSIGLNYRDHAEELGMDVPEEPVIFIKPSTAVIGPGDTIIYPTTSERVDYEAELGIVIKSLARGITPRQAKSHILGYTCVNDVTARDQQKKDGQWTRSKSYDTFAPLGPWIETELDPASLFVRTYLNGELKQDSTTLNFIFPVDELVSFASGVMTLLPGDVISTGTPSGIGPMEPGDEVAIEIEGIGRLVNRIELPSKMPPDEVADRG